MILLKTRGKTKVSVDKKTMCREHKTTVQFLLMQVFLQLFLNGIFTEGFAKPQKGILNKNKTGLDQLINNIAQKPKRGYLLSFELTCLLYYAFL